jgi:hypothetical protein
MLPAILGLLLPDSVAKRIDFFESHTGHSSQRLTQMIWERIINNIKPDILYRKRDNTTLPKRKPGLD